MATRNGVRKALKEMLATAGGKTGDLRRYLGDRGLVISPKTAYTWANYARGKGNGKKPRKSSQEQILAIYKGVPQAEMPIAERQRGTLRETVFEVPGLKITVREF